MLPQKFGLQGGHWYNLKPKITEIKSANRRSIHIISSDLGTDAAPVQLQRIKEDSWTCPNSTPLVAFRYL